VVLCDSWLIAQDHSLLYCRYIKGLLVKNLTLFANTVLSIFPSVLSLKLYPEVGHYATDADVL